MRKNTRKDERAEFVEKVRSGNLELDQSSSKFKRWERENRRKELRGKGRYYYRVNAKCD
jgi:hypothetical protein